MAAKSPELRLLLGHTATILPDAGTGFGETPLTPYSTNGRLPRARPQHTWAGFVREGKELVDFYHIGLGRTEYLPEPQDGVYNIVSKLTIQAALRERRTIQDLLFLYGDIRGRRHGKDVFFGVRGLGRPVVRGHIAPLSCLPEGFGREVENACPYPIKRYASDTPDFVPRDYPSHTVLATAPARRRLQVAYNEQLDYDLSKQLGIPVYNTEAVGVKGYKPRKVVSVNALRIVNPNVTMCLGAEAVRAGLIIVAHGVRNIETNTLLGGRAYGMFGPSVLTSYRI